MRVLHLITCLNPGGIEYWLTELVKATVNSDVEMAICCRTADTGALSGQLTEIGVRVLSCPMLPNLWSYDRRLQALIAESGADLVHNHMGATSSFAVRAARNANTPVVTTFHSPQFMPQTSVTRKPIIRQLRGMFTRRSVAYAVCHSDLVTGVSRGVLETIMPDYQASEKFRVTYLGIPPRSVTQRAEFDIRSSQGWPRSAPLVAKLGRLSPEKDPLACIDIFRRVHDAIPAARFVVIGDGPLRMEMAHRLRQLGISKYVALLGYRDDANSLLRQVQVLLHPSKYEGFGLAVAEAAALGVPSVVTDIPGLNEAVIDGETGFLHAPGATTEMAQSTIALLSDTDLHATISGKAAAFATTHFGAVRCHSAMLDIYRELVG